MNFRPESLQTRGAGTVTRSGDVDYVGEARSEDCPICEEPALTLVSFAFGARLPASGRCITTKKELAQLKRGSSEATCYVVEVCTGCAWNQLVRSFRLGNPRAAAP